MTAPKTPKDTQYQLPEEAVPGHRLGRHVHFDPRSVNYRTPAKRVLRPGDVLWSRRGVFDQGNLGSCTGEAAAGVCASGPYYKAIRAKGLPADPLSIYHLATTLDNVPGDYPPSDTGSTVLAAMKACKAIGLTSGYVWCFGLPEVLATLQKVGPVEVGVSWYDSFDTPKGVRAVVSLPDGASVRGGHAFELIGDDASRQEVRAVNSWGSGWGDRGRFSIPYTVLDRLLNEDGEAATVVL